MITDHMRIINTQWSVNIIFTPIFFKAPEYEPVFPEDDDYDHRVKDGEEKIFSAIGRLNLHLTKIANHYFRFMDTWMEMNFKRSVEITDCVSLTSYIE